VYLRRRILILFSHIRLGIRSILFYLCFRTKLLYLFIIVRVSDSVKRVYLYGTVHSHLNTNAVLLTNFYLLYMFPQKFSTFRDLLLGIK